MEISNLSSAWLLIAIVVLVIVTRVVLYYRAKAKRKEDNEIKARMKQLDLDYEKKVADDLLFCMKKPHIAPSGKVPVFTPPKPPPVRIIKGDKVVNQKEVDDYNSNSMYVLSNSYAAQDGYSNTVCKHVPENPNMILTSCPPQQKCKKCGKFYFI